MQTPVTVLGRLSIVLAVATSSALASTQEEVFQRTVPAAGVRKLSVHNVNGAISVPPWDKPEIRIVAKKRVRHSSQEAAEQYARQIEIAVETKGDVLEVRWADGVVSPVQSGRSYEEWPNVYHRSPLRVVSIAPAADRAKLRKRGERTNAIYQYTLASPSGCPGVECRARRMRRQDNAEEQGRRRCAVRPHPIGPPGAMLLVAAGTVEWPGGWVFLGIMGTGSLAISLWLLKHDPALLAERLSPVVQRRQAAWDRALMAGCLVLWFSWLAFTALDAVRWRWSDVSVWAQVVGGAGMAATFYVVYLHV
jgi:hypothetical protein